MPGSKVKSSRERRELTRAKKKLREEIVAAKYKPLDMVPSTASSHKRVATDGSRTKASSGFRISAEKAKVALQEVAQKFANSKPPPPPDNLSKRVEVVRMNVASHSGPPDEDATMALIPETQEFDLDPNEGNREVPINDPIMEFDSQVTSNPLIDDLLSILTDPILCPHVGSFKATG